MRTIQLVSAVAVIALSSLASAQSPRTLLNDDQINAFCAEAYEAYIMGGATGVLREENSCWEDMKANTNDTESLNIGARCGVIAMAGMFIEAAQARKEIRGMLPIYSPQSIGKRVDANMGERFQGREHIVKGTRVIDDPGKIIVGLMAAGMR